MTPIGVGVGIAGGEKILKKFFSQILIFFVELPGGMSELPTKTCFAPFLSKSSSIFSIFTERVIFDILDGTKEKRHSVDSHIRPGIRKDLSS